MTLTQSIADQLATYPAVLVVGVVGGWACAARRRRPTTPTGMNAQESAEMIAGALVSMAEQGVRFEVGRRDPEPPESEVGGE